MFKLLEVYFSYTQDQPMDIVKIWHIIEHKVNLKMLFFSSKLNYPPPTKVLVAPLNISTTIK